MPRLEARGGETLDGDLVRPDPPGVPARHDRPILDAFLEGKAETTVRAYAKDLDHFARWWFAPPQSARAAHRAAWAVDQLLACDAGRANGLVLAYRNFMLAAGLASATVARRLAALRSVVKLARTLGLVAWSVEVSAPKPEPRRDVRGPDEKEFGKLWKSLKAAGDGPRARRERAAVALLFGMGLRRAEVCSLDLCDVDFPAREISVKGKGRREKARLPMPTEAAKALGDWILIRGYEPGPLFVRTDRPGSKGRLGGEGLARAVAKAGADAGLAKRLRPHGLRHSAITFSLSGGKTVREVRAFSRHEKVETVMRYDDERENLSKDVSASLGKKLR